MDNKAECMQITFPMIKTLDSELFALYRYQEEISVDDKIFQLDVESQSENTIKAKKQDLRYWRAYLSAKGYGISEPITETTMIDFALDHAFGLPDELEDRLTRGFAKNPGRYRFSTIKRRIFNLCSVLKMHALKEGKGLVNPYGMRLANCLSKLEKNDDILGPKKAHKAVTLSILKEMLATCSDTLLDCRDAALLSLAWASGGRRAGEVVELLYDDIYEEDGEYIIDLYKSKTNQEGRSDKRMVRGQAARYLREWLYWSGVKSGPLFRRVLKGGNISAEGLNRQTVRYIVKQRVEMCGYDPMDFTAHSLRKGFVTEAIRQDVSFYDLMALTGHTSINTVKKYYQASTLVNNKGTMLF
jgi:integrase